MKNKQKGSVWLIIILIIVVVIGVGIYYFQAKTNTEVVTDSNPQTSYGVNLKNYTDTQSRFSFSYPSDWSLHTTNSGVYVLTKQHEASDNPGGKTIDFSVSVCKLSDQTCATKKQELDQVIKSYSENHDTKLSLNGKNGGQYVISGAGDYYSAVIESNGNLYVLGSTVQEYEARYPAKMSNPQVKAIFDSFKFAK